MSHFRIVYLCADLRRVGPTNQTYNIIVNANESLDDVLVLTLFDEPKDSQKKMFEDKGIKCECLALNRHNLVSAAIKLISFFKRNRIELIHSYGVKPDILLYFVAGFVKVPYVLTQRCIPIEDYPTRMPPFVGTFIALMHTFVLKHSKHVVTCSQHLSEVMKSRYKCNNVTPIQNGIDTSRFMKLDKQKLRSKLGLPSDAIIFISTGLFLERKHNDELIEAFLQVDSPKKHLLMLGNGPLFNQIENKYVNNPNIQFLGLVSNISEWLSAADFFLSASDSEGLPNAVLEALACGCPVILSDIPQHREILDSLPTCGKTFKLHDINELTLIMNNCTTYGFNFNETRDALEASSFTMQTMGKKYNSFYKGL